MIKLRGMSCTGHVVCVGGKMLSCRILVGKCVLQKLNWINLAHDRDQWLAPVNTITKLRVL